MTVPDLSDYTQEDARNALEKLGFKVSSVTKTADSATIEKDKVVSTDPASGTSQPKGTTITLYISSGMTKCRTVWSASPRTRCWTSSRP